MARRVFQVGAALKTPIGRRAAAAAGRFGRNAARGAGRFAARAATGIRRNAKPAALVAGVLGTNVAANYAGRKSGEALANRLFRKKRTRRTAAPAGKTGTGAGAAA